MNTYSICLSLHFIFLLEVQCKYEWIITNETVFFFPHNNYWLVYIGVQSFAIRKKSVLKIDIYISSHNSIKKMLNKSYKIVFTHGSFLAILKFYRFYPDTKKIHFYLRKYWKSYNFPQFVMFNFVLVCVYAADILFIHRKDTIYFV